MSSFNFCVIGVVLVASVHSYVVPQKVHVSFIDSTYPTNSWTLDKVVDLLDKAYEVRSTFATTNAPPQTVETGDRDELKGLGCPRGLKKAGTTCVRDADESVEIGERDGIAGGFKNCPEGYKRAGPACVPAESDPTDEPRAAAPVKEVRKEINKCPAGYKKAGPACVRDEDYESYEDES